LAEELQRERVNHSIADRASAAMRKEIVFLLPKLAAQKKQSDARNQKSPLSSTMQRDFR
jgi:hypothetical protein